MPERCTIICDGFDREVLARLLRGEPSLRDAVERIGRLLPHPEILLCDLFSALYKMNVVLRPAAELSAAVLLHRRLLEVVIGSRGFAELHKRTELHEEECAAALPSLVDRILRALGRELRFGPEKLLDAASAAHDEEERAQRQAELDHLEELPEGSFDPDARRQLEGSLEADIAELDQRIAAAHERQEAAARKLSTELDDSIALKVSVLPEQLDGAEEQLKSLGLSVGGDGRVQAQRRLMLGERLMRSRKLQLLAKLVGAFREVAFEARRKRVVRSPQELHSVTAGANLERLLPSELLGLSRRQGALHLEFLRRLSEGKLLEYELSGASSRGPMVVCVDGSGSMRGSKELWAKAVALTLMEIARRQRRRCLGIIFSSGEPLFEVEFLGQSGASRGRAPVLDENVLDFAERFPGGGTDFEPPLQRALDAVATGDYRRGDIVFISDGQANVSETLVAALGKKRKKHRFRIRGIVVDVADSSVASLERFCDDVRQVSDLATDSLSDLFAGV